jgi:hypothetical protein
VVINGYYISDFCGYYISDFLWLFYQWLLVDILLVVISL